MMTSTYQSPHGGVDLLGMRRRAGHVEIFYDDGVARRKVWRVLSRAASEGLISDALRYAAGQSRVLPALYAELKRRAIAIEAVA